MYGTIARLKVKNGAVEQLRKMETERRPEGFVTSYVFQSDTNANEMWLVAIFKDKDTYLVNAASPEQDQEYRQLLQYLEADPEWHDGEIVVSA